MKTSGTTGDLGARFAPLSTPLVADACLRTGTPSRLAPAGIRPLIEDGAVAGRALPVRHAGSVDVFLEVFELAEPGDILVIDNGGRLEEGCIGDLTVLEAKAAGVSGVILWGAYRDSTELREIGLPLFAYGTCPAGPRELRPREPDVFSCAQFGTVRVGREDAVFADADGVLFVELEKVAEVLAAAEEIAATERRQAELVRSGRRLRDQLQLEAYLARRERDPDYSFREHLRELGAAIEE